MRPGRRPDSWHSRARAIGAAVLLCCGAGCETAAIEMAGVDEAVDSLEERLRQDTSTWQVWALDRCREGSGQLRLAFDDADDVFALTVAARGGEELDVTLEGASRTDTIAFLYLVSGTLDGPASERTLRLVAQDDDGGDAALSRLTGVSLPAPAQYAVVLTSRRDSAAGEVLVSVALDGTPWCRGAGEHDREGPRP